MGIMRSVLLNEITNILFWWLLLVYKYSHCSSLFIMVPCTHILLHRILALMHPAFADAPELITTIVDKPGYERGDNDDPSLLAADNLSRLKLRRNDSSAG